MPVSCSRDQSVREAKAESASSIDRLEALSVAAGEWCLLDACEERRQQAADAFAAIATDPAELLRLSNPERDRLLSAARRMADDGATDGIKARGAAAVARLEGVVEIGQRIASGAAAVFLPSTPFDFAASADLKPQKDFWTTVWTTPGEKSVAACSQSKKGASVIDPASARQVGEARKKAACRPGDAFEIFKGKAGDFDVGAERFRPWRAIFEEVFRQQGLPTFLAALAIPESDMVPHRDSPAKAAGTFQIMPDNTNLPAYDIQSDRMGAGIDERKNPYLAARTSALLLAEMMRRIRSKRPSGKGPDGFVNEALFDEPRAALLALAGYHAGGGILNAALCKAREELRAEGRLVKTAGIADEAKRERALLTNGAMIFDRVMTKTDPKSEFGRNSQHYPMKAVPVMAAFYAEGAEAAPPPPAEMAHLVMVEIASFAAPTGLRDILQLSGMEARAFANLNPQFTILETGLPGKKAKREFSEKEDPRTYWERTYEQIDLRRGAVNRLRLVLPAVEARLLVDGLVAEGRVKGSGEVAGSWVLPPADGVQPFE